MKENSLTKTRRLTITSILAAIVVIVSFLPLKTLGFEINFSMVPVVIGGILYGPATGAILGAIFGIVSFIQCFGYSALGALLLTENAFLTIIVCIPTRILAGFIPSLAFKLIKKAGKIGNTLSFPVASLLAPLLNTVFFMSALTLCFYNGDTIQHYVKLLGAANPFIFILLFVGVNGIIEIVAGFIVAYPVAKAAARHLKA